MEPFGLTRLQRDCLGIIQEMTAAAGCAPSYDELRHELGVASKGNVVRLVDCLVQRGHLARMKGRARSLVVLAPVTLEEEPEFVGLFDALELLAASGVA